MPMFLPAEFDLTSPGDSEALAFYFNAFEVSGYDLKAFIVQQSITDESIDQLLSHLKEGFTKQFT